MGKLLGIDYGTKRVGLALSDKRGRVAFPHATLENDTWLLSNLTEVIKQEQVAEIVIGESLTYKRAENPLMKEVEFFKAMLEQKLALPIHLEPEWLTSHEARRTARTKRLVDASAAALMLQTFLDKRAHGTRPT